jgi:hypothetical protein
LPTQAFKNYLRKKRECVARVHRRFPLRRLREWSGGAMKYPPGASLRKLKAALQALHCLLSPLRGPLLPLAWWWRLLPARKDSATNPPGCP